MKPTKQTAYCLGADPYLPIGIFLPIEIFIYLKPMKNE